jgi:phosphate transport system protein
MNNDLERIGDHEVNIARTVKDLVEKALIETVEDLPEMSEMACSMLHDAVNAFVHQDPELARSVCQRDVTVDRYYDEIIKKNIEILKKQTDK